jgi:hypothetical protein
MMHSRLGSLARVMSVRLTPIQHHSPTISGAAISNPAARSSLSPFSLPQYPRVVLDYRTPRARLHLAVARLLPRSSSYQVPCEGRPLASHSRTPRATSQLPQRYDESPTVLCPLAIYQRASLVPVARSLGPLVLLSHASCPLPSQWRARFRFLSRLFSLSSICAHSPHQARSLAG